MPHAPFTPPQPMPAPPHGVDVRRSQRTTLRRVLLGALLIGIGGLAPSAFAEATHLRVRPLPEAEWSPEVRQMLGATRDRVAALEGADAADAASKEAPKTLNILRTVAHHPDLLGPFLGFATALAQEGALSRRDSELLALRASWHGQSDFEWGHHVVYALAAGLTDEEIARIAVGPDAPGWSKEDRALLRAADQLCARQQIDDALWDELAKRFSEKQLVEIPFVVGQYMMLSMVANSTGVQLEPGLQKLPVRAAP